MNRPFGQVTLRFKCDCCGALFDSYRGESTFTDEDGIRAMMRKLPEFWWYHTCEAGKRYGTATAVGIIVQ